MNSLSSFLFPRRGQAGLALGLFLLVSVFGCFKDPKIDVSQPRKCQTDKNCPWKYVCGLDKYCCASSDGRTCSNPGGIDGSPGDDAPTARETGAGGTTGLSEVGAGGGRTGGAAGSGGIIGGRGGGGADGGIDSPLGGASGRSGGGEAVNSGSGGATQPGGTSDSGGVTGFGGTSDSGGVTGPGGTSGTGGVIVTGGTRASGGATGSGGAASGGTGTGGTGPGGTGGQTIVTCGSGKKDCNGTCIATSECCGGCSGTKPVCNNGTCVARSLGDSCQISGECTSGVCADNVCCNELCSGVCEACNLAGTKKGTCSPTTTPRAGLSCTTDASYAMCGGSCDGVEAHRKVCFYPPTSTQCVAGLCDSTTNTVTDPRLCDGLGRCGTVTPRSCSPYTCQNALSCSTACPTGENTCGGSTCVPLNTDTRCGTCSNNCTTSSRHCSAGTTCVQCTVDSHCSGSTPRCNTTTNTCVQCTSNGGCSGAKPVCSNNVCVECAASPDCATRTDRKHVCSINTCIECASNQDCSNYADAPKCNNGTCVRCTLPSDCSAQYGTYALCKSDNTCACRQPSTTNLLTQNNAISTPGFDGTLGQWTFPPCAGCPRPLADYDSTKDADQCPLSGSGHITADFLTGSISRCVVASANTVYYLGYSYQIVPANPAVLDPESVFLDCMADAYEGSTCTGDSLTNLTIPTLVKERGSSWSSKAGGYYFRSSYLTGSILVSCNTRNIGEAWVDWVYLNTADTF